MESIGFKLFIVFMVSWFIHLPARIPLLGAVRFDLLLVFTLGVLTILWAQKGREQLFAKSQTGKYLAIVFIYAILTIPFAMWPGSVIKSGLPNFIKAVVFYYFTVAFITSEKRVKIIILVFVACQTFRVLEPLYLHMTKGYWGSKAFWDMSGEYINRLSGAPHDFINPNGLAYIIVSIIPFYYFLSFTSLKWKIASFPMIPLMIYAMILTGSRSGLIALFVISIFILFKSKRKILISAILALAVIIFITQLKPEQIDRFLSIVDSSSKNYTTFQDRIGGVKEAFDIALERPIFGHGLGTSLEASWNVGGITVMAHNLYAEISQEIGVLGLIIFLLFMKSIVKSYLQINKAMRKSYERSRLLYKVADALQVYLVMNIVFSLASYGLSGYAWYFLAGFSVVLIRLFSQVTSNEKLEFASS